MEIKAVTTFCPLAVQWVLIRFKQLSFDAVQNEADLIEMSSLVESSPAFWTASRKHSNPIKTYCMRWDRREEKSSKETIAFVHFCRGKFIREKKTNLRNRLDNYLGNETFSYVAVRENRTDYAACVHNECHDGSAVAIFRILKWISFCLQIINR